MQSNKVNWLSVIVYYVLACAISWPFFWWRDMNAASWARWSVPGFVKTWSFMWGPAIAALLCLLLFKKSHRKTITFFGPSLIQSLLFYGVPVLALAAAGVSGQGMNPHLFPLVFGVLGFISILGEEWGWRGFLQDALRPLPPLPRYALIGTLWELWHFTNRMGHGEPQQIIIRVTIWIAALCVVSFIIGKATDKSRSIVVAVTLHAWIDILIEFNQLTTFIVFGLSIPFWLYLLWRWEGKNNGDLNVSNKQVRPSTVLVQ